MWMATSKMSVKSFEQGQMIPIQSLNTFIYSCFMFFPRASERRVLLIL